jgi:hypothetical protein
MIKPIKFDLKLNNGETLRTLDDLKNNLSPELFEHFQSGKLAKWLRVRKLEEQANAVEKLLAEVHDREVQSFKGLIELFGGETDVDSLRTEIAERKKMSSAIQNSDDEIEQLKVAFEQEIEVLKAKIEQLKNPPKPKETVIENFIHNDDGTVTDIKTGLMWQQKEQTRYVYTSDVAVESAKSSNFAGYNDWRLPTIDELKSFIDIEFKQTHPKLIYFNELKFCFWSSSRDVSAWSVGIKLGGSSYYGNKDVSVLLVR